MHPVGRQVPVCLRRVRVGVTCITCRNAFGLHVNRNRLPVHVNIVSSVIIVR